MLKKFNPFFGRLMDFKDTQTFDIQSEDACPPSVSFVETGCGAFHVWMEITG